jgi:hypothetical protein
VAAEEASRRLLLETLMREHWSLTAAAKALDMAGAAAVIKAIRQLGLTDLYEQARARGEIRPGVRPRETSAE